MDDLPEGRLMSEKASKCPSCGAPIPRGRDACPTCGRPVPVDTEAPTVSGPDAGTREAPPAFSDFDIVRPLGAGGMGTVYEVRQKSMRRTVALKVLDPGTVPSRTAESRFEREAWIGGRLSHPNIVKVFSQGVEGRSHYIAMELAGGGSLEDLIRRTRGERNTAGAGASARREYTQRIVSLFASVADALSHAHESGVVHRDIKPSNLLLSEDHTRLLLSDFGLARDKECATLTRRGDFLGTVRYMSPELLLAQRVRVDHRSDIWSLGVSLYEAITLDLPYAGDSEEAYISAVSMREPIPARSRDAAITRDLETILMKCLERDPDDRYASARELKEDLVRFLDGRPVLAQRPGLFVRAQRFVRRRPALTATVAVAVVIAVAAASFTIQERRRRARCVAVLTQMEEGGRISEYEARLNISRELSPEERELRDAFLAGRLPNDLRDRLARQLLWPKPRINPYVDRTQYDDPLDALWGEIVQWHWDWGLVAVVEPTILLDGHVLTKRPAQIPWGAIELLTGDEIQEVATGPQELVVEFDAWFFAMSDVVSGEDERPSWNDPVNFVDASGVFLGSAEGAKADSYLVYGPDSLPWERFWPRFIERARSVRVGPIRYPPEHFTLTDGPLPGRPIRIASPEIDAAMTAAVKFDYCRLALWTREDEPGHVGYDLDVGIRIDTPLPAPLVSTVEVETPWGRAHGHSLPSEDNEDAWREPCVSVRIDQGETTFIEPWAPLLWTERRKPADYPPLPRHADELDAIAPFPVHVTLRPPDAGQALEFDSFWDGVIEIDTLATFVLADMEQWQ